MAPSGGSSGGYSGGSSGEVAALVEAVNKLIPSLTSLTDSLSGKDDSGTTFAQDLAGVSSDLKALVKFNDGDKSADLKDANGQSSVAGKR